MSSQELYAAIDRQGGLDEAAADMVGERTVEDTAVPR
jgi:hypothetical protein